MSEEVGPRISEPVAEAQVGPYRVVEHVAEWSYSDSFGGVVGGVEVSQAEAVQTTGLLVEVYEGTDLKASITIIPTTEQEYVVEVAGGGFPRDVLEKLLCGLEEILDEAPETVADWEGLVEALFQILLEATSEPKP